MKKKKSPNEISKLNYKKEELKRKRRKNFAK